MNPDRRPIAATLAAIVLLPALAFVALPVATAEPPPADEYGGVIRGLDTFSDAHGNCVTPVRLLGTTPVNASASFSCAHGRAVAAFRTLPTMAQAYARASGHNPTDFVRWFAATASSSQNVYYFLDGPIKEGSHEITVRVEIEVVGSSAPGAGPAGAWVNVGGHFTGLDTYTSMTYDCANGPNVNGQKPLPVDFNGDCASFRFNTTRDLIGRGPAGYALAVNFAAGVDVSKGDLPLETEVLVRARAYVVSAPAGFSVRSIHTPVLTDGRAYSPELVHVTLEDTPLASMLNTTDISGRPATYEVLAQPAKADVALDAGGAFRFVPKPNFHGLVTFPFRKTVDGVSTDDVAAVRVLPVNDAPVAAASAPPIVMVGESILLDGTESFDVDGADDIRSFAWSRNGESIGAGSTLTLPTDVTMLGWHTFRLDVTDAAGARDDALTQPVYVNAPPVASARAGAGVLDATASFEPDVENDRIVAYDWSFGAAGEIAPFAFPAGRDVCGTLTVTDSFGASERDGLCLPEAEARAQAFRVALADGPLQASQGAFIDALGSDEAAFLDHAVADSQIVGATESATVAWRGPQIVATSRAELLRADLLGGALVIEGLEIEAEATWDVDALVPTHAVKRSIARLTYLGSPVDVGPREQGPQRIELPGGMVIDLFVASVDTDPQGHTYREDAVRLSLPGGATVVLGSVTAQAGTSAMEPTQSGLSDLLAVG